MTEQQADAATHSADAATGSGRGHQLAPQPGPAQQTSPAAAEADPFGLEQVLEQQQALDAKQAAAAAWSPEVGRKGCYHSAVWRFCMSLHTVGGKCLAEHAAQQRQRCRLMPSVSHVGGNVHAAGGATRLLRQHAGRVRQGLGAAVRGDRC